MKFLSAAIAIAALSVVCPAQMSMTLPVGFDTMSGGSGGTSFPFNNTADHRWQWHYANSNFAGVTGPITITDISVRAENGTLSMAAFDFPSLEIWVGSGTTGYTVAQHDPVFANNVCTDFTMVRSGQWMGGPVPASGGSAATWVSMGPITTPFVFDPGAGRDLIIELVKCGTVATIGAALDGSSGAAGTNGGNRYGDTASCTATSSSFANNEFVPIVRIDYVMGGTPGICLTEFQVNQAASTMTVNGAPDAGGGQPITTLLGLGATASIDLSSTLAGNAWDIGFDLGALSVALSSGGFATPGGQTVNMNLASAGFTWLNNNFSTGGGFANTSLLFTPANPIMSAGQMGVVDPANADGIAVSHVNELIVVPCQGSNFDQLGLGTTPPPGWSNGTGGTLMWTVDASGTPSVGTGPTAAASGANYAYCETSANFGGTFVLDTCSIDLTGIMNPTGTLTFSLSRIGATIGMLELLVDDGSGAGFIPITDPATGLPVVYMGPDPAQMQGGTEWSSESVPFLHNIATSNAAIRFRYTSGTSFTGDIAIDDVAVN